MSQGSTTSLQSVGVGAGFQPGTDQQISGHPTVGYPQHQPPNVSHPYNHNPEETLLNHFQPQQSTEHSSVQQHEIRPMSQHGFHNLHSYHVQYPDGFSQYPMQHAAMPPQHMQHMRHASEQYIEGSPAPDDSNNELNGAKRRKGTASSLANDQELRRLLNQYQGKTLKEVAAEVQRNEGAGGKSEKAKQVFAMLWLQENCRRSNNSVRRDRVFSRYTERCGNERVPTLNPASFGKLVRIIFPNVQTRRLGVRGESKYHYVDLSLYPDDNESQPSAPQVPAALDDWQRQDRYRQNSAEMASKSFNTHTRSSSESRNVLRESMDTADFPAPSLQFLPRTVDGPTDVVSLEADGQSLNIDCQFLNTPTIRIPIGGMPSSLIAALPSVRATLQASLPTYLAMPQKNSRTLTPPSSQDSLFELPDIHTYLIGTNYDVSIANSLSHLYRSYCIDVIDAFRKCKEKPFFNHHSAFNGKMTVPVAKLFSLENVAPWIRECDMLMYKQMIRVVAPLALQEVPQQVWAVFDRVSARLVGHLVSAFEEKCPVHVLVAKIVPAARFCSVLKKLKGANTAAMHVAGMLQDERFRTQMWVDFLSMVDPNQVVDESLPPPESLRTVEGILSSDIKVLVSPIADPVVEAAEQDLSSQFASFALQHIDEPGVLSTVQSPSAGPLDHWVQWLECLSEPFDRHHPQCMINWHIRFWKSVMTQLGIGGAQSYQGWWYLEAFLTSMLDCITQLEGILMDESAQKDLEQREWKKRKQLEDRQEARKNIKAQSHAEGGSKRKRDNDDVGGEERSRPQSQSGSKSETQEAQPTEDNHQQQMDGGQSHQQSRPGTSDTMEAMNVDGTVDLEQPSAADVQAEDDDDEEMNQIRRSGPLDLPSIGLNSSPLKRLLQQTPGRAKEILGGIAHDDSGIDLGLDLEIGGDERSPSKVNAEETLKKIRRELGLWSDPVDGDGQVIVV